MTDYQARGLLRRSHAALSSSEPGRRGQALDLLGQAEALRSRDRGGVAPVRRDATEVVPTRLELRNEAAAALLLSDVRPVFELQGQVGMAASLRPDGDQALFVDFDFAAARCSVRQMDLRTGKELFRRSAAAALPAIGGLAPDGRQMAALAVPLKAGKGSRPQVQLFELPDVKRQRVLPYPADLPGTPTSKGLGAR